LKNTSRNRIDTQTKDSIKLTYQLSSSRPYILATRLTMTYEGVVPEASQPASQQARRDQASERASKQAMVGQINGPRDSGDALGLK
jgi:hypothetical protein